MKQKISLISCVVLACVSFTACAEESSNSVAEYSYAPENTSTVQSADGETNNAGALNTDLQVCFGDEGEPFVLHLEDNATAKQIAEYVGETDWRLPIYHYDDFEDWEVMQYYDIPESYEIPSAPETVTSEKAGEVYYSEPNRIVLFYKDAEVEGEYTKVGYFDYSDEFLSAVENNPVLEGWGNKIVLISD